MEPHHYQHQQQHLYPHPQQQQQQLPYAASAHLHLQQLQQQLEQLQGPDPDHHQQQQQQQQAGAGSGAGDRFPQWTADETKVLLSIREEMDRSFLETKRNKSLWQAISERMKGQGFDRTPDQCKCKWKNLVTRYKGTASMEAAETSRQTAFPFTDDMRRIFSHRMETMQAAAPQVSYKQELGEGDDLGILPLEDDDIDADLAAHDQYLATTWSTPGEFDQGDTQAPQAAAASTSPTAAQQVRQDHHEPSTSKRPKRRKIKPSTPAEGSTRAHRQGDAGGTEQVRRALREFLGWQMRAEEDRIRVAESREAQRKEEDREWRRSMEAMAVERAEMDRLWRQRQEERRAREDDRAETRHQLIVALLNKLNATTSST